MDQRGTSGLRGVRPVDRTETGPRPRHTDWDENLRQLEELPVGMPGGLEMQRSESQRWWVAVPRVSFAVW